MWCGSRIGAGSWSCPSPTSYQDPGQSSNQNSGRRGGCHAWKIGSLSRFSEVDIKQLMCIFNYFFNTNLGPLFTGGIIEPMQLLAAQQVNYILKGRLRATDALPTKESLELSELGLQLI